MHIFEEVKQCTRAPCLCVARIMTVCPVLVCEFGNTRPRIVLDVMAEAEQSSMKMVKGIDNVLFLCEVRSDCGGVDGAL